MNTVYRAQYPTYSSEYKSINIRFMHLYKKYLSFHKSSVQKKNNRCYIRCYMRLCFNKMFQNKIRNSELFLKFLNLSSSRTSSSYLQYLDQNLNIDRSDPHGEAKHSRYHDEPNHHGEPHLQQQSRYTPQVIHPSLTEICHPLVWHIGFKLSTEERHNVY